MYRRQHFDWKYSINTKLYMCGIEHSFINILEDVWQPVNTKLPRKQQSHWKSKSYCQRVIKFKTYRFVSWITTYIWRRKSKTWTTFTHTCNKTSFDTLRSYTRSSIIERLKDKQTVKCGVDISLAFVLQINGFTWGKLVYQYHNM